MKKIITKEINICDICSSEHVYGDVCLCCGIYYCSEHSNLGIDFLHSCFSGGTGDIFFCNNCIENLDACVGIDKFIEIYQIYNKIRKLGIKQEIEYELFRKQEEKLVNLAAETLKKYKINDNYRYV
ncbi:MAG: hypothetical protein Q7R52_00025 [archaeon]|nr:hypothetical protein [archaeon]